MSKNKISDPEHACWDDDVCKTQVLDLKAYDPVYDGVSDPQVPAWLRDNLDLYSGAAEKT